MSADSQLKDESSMVMEEASWLEIDLKRIASNLACWRSQVNPATHPERPNGPVKICAVVKANAYGLGAVPIARALEEAGLDMLAVYSPQQALELLEAGIRCPILVLMPMRSSSWQASVSWRLAAIQARLHLVINDVEQVETARWLADQAQAQIPVHLHVDTGMSRAGLASTQVPGVLEKIHAVSALRLAGVMSHLATAHTDGSFDETQRLRFVELLQAHPCLQAPGVCRHLAATAGVCRGKPYFFDMVRIGLGLWGHGPDLLSHGQTAWASALRPVMRWRTRLVHLQRYPEGRTVGYGRTCRLQRDSLLGVAAAGYGDGYPLSQSNRGLVMVLGVSGWQAAPILGRVSMDQIVVDLTDLMGVEPGALVELVSADKTSPCTLPEVAKQAQTSEYEILCRLSPRLPRHYVDFDAGSAPTIDHAMQS